MTDATTTEATATDAAAAPVDARPRRTGLLVGGAVGAAVLVLGMGIPTGIWATDRLSAGFAAQDDAQLLDEARKRALDAAAEFSTTVDLALAYLESAAVPVKEASANAPEAFGDSAVSVVARAVDSLTGSLEPPTLLPVPVASDSDTPPSDESESGSDADAESVANVGADEATEGQTPDDGAAETEATGPIVRPWSMRLPYVPEETESLSDALGARYVELSGNAREAEREIVAAETRRFDGLAAMFARATTRVIGAVESADRALLEAVAAAISVGEETRASLEHASDDALAELDAAIDALRPLADAESSLDWDERSVDSLTALAGVADAIDTYVAADESARASHEANKPVQRRPYACLKYSWVGTYIGWCW